jgi:hypothetical protein
MAKINKFVSREINLLPPDLGPSASVLKLLDLAKKAAVVISIIFFIFGTLFVGYVIFLRVQIQASIKKSDSLKSSITVLKSTEHSIYLLKERVDKIKILFSKETQERSLTNSSSILLNHPEINFTQVLTSAGKVSISGNSKTSANISYFFEAVLADNNYININLMSFYYNPISGYTFSFDLYLK